MQQKEEKNEKKKIKIDKNYQQLIKKEQKQKSIKTQV